MPLLVPVYSCIITAIVRDSDDQDIIPAPVPLPSRGLSLILLSLLE